MTKTYDLACPVARSLEIIGDRWTLLIVRELLLGRTRYSEVAQSLTGIPPNLLSDRLRLLEHEGIVERLGVRRGYTLTPKGHELAPVLGGLAVWGMRHYGEPPNALATHVECGGTVRPAGRCMRCGAEVDALEVHLEPGDPQAWDDEPPGDVLPDHGVEDGEPAGHGQAEWTAETSSGKPSGKVVAGTEQQTIRERW